MSQNPELHIISVKLKIQQRLYFPKSASQTSFNNNIKRNFNQSLAGCSSEVNQ